MGFIDDAKSAINSVAKSFGKDNLFPADPTESLADEFDAEFETGNWKITGSDWYQVYGYQFVVKNGGGKSYKFTLPIPPQNLVVKPIMASKATPTIGGVVEETSGVVFWNIQLQGTTGIASSRDEADVITKKKVATQFRENITTTGLLSGIAANLAGTLGKVGGFADKLKDSFDDPSFAGIAEGFVGAANIALLPPTPYAQSAVNRDSNGFTEAQELQKFFFMYSKMKGLYPQLFSMYFRYQKTNQEWRVVVKDFSLQISAQNPNLYKYSITLQGWDCQAIGDDDKLKPVDRFGKDGDLKSVNVLNSGLVTMPKLSLNKILGK